MASGDQWKSYKTKGNIEEGRRRREEVGLQFRETKCEEVGLAILAVLQVLNRRYLVLDIREAEHTVDVSLDDDVALYYLLTRVTWRGPR